MCDAKGVCVAGKTVTDKGVPKFCAVYKEVFVGPNCSGCHGFWGTSNSTYNKLTTGFCCNDSCISKGNGSASAIYKKVAPGVSAPCGSKMPDGTSGVSAAAAKILKDWIDGGAPK